MPESHLYFRAVRLLLFQLFFLAAVFLAEAFFTAVFFAAAAFLGAAAFLDSSPAEAGSSFAEDFLVVVFLAAVAFFGAAESSLAALARVRLTGFSSVAAFLTLGLLLAVIAAAVYFLLSFSKNKKRLPY